MGFLTPRVQRNINERHKTPQRKRSESKGGGEEDDNVMHDIGKGVLGSTASAKSADKLRSHDDGANKPLDRQTDRISF